MIPDGIARRAVSGPLVQAGVSHSVYEIRVLCEVESSEELWVDCAVEVSNRTSVGRGKEAAAVDNAMGPSDVFWSVVRL